jgi:transcriptional regulator with XRE-family HTH domain
MENRQLGWSFRKLAHRSGLPVDALSKALNNGTGLTWELCARLSRALRLSPTSVFRKARLLPPQPESRDEELAEMLETLAMLPEGPIHDEATKDIRAIARHARRRAQRIEQG